MKKIRDRNKVDKDKTVIKLQDVKKGKDEVEQIKGGSRSKKDTRWK